MSNDNEAIDMTGKEIAGKNTVDPLEKEEREAAKKKAPLAKKGEYIVACSSLKSDGKKMKKGDEYVGKLYHDLVSRGSVVTKVAWDKR